MTKSDILNNLREYTASELVDAINAGEVTLYELCKSGNLKPSMRMRIENELAKLQCKNQQTLTIEDSSVVKESSTEDTNTNLNADCSTNRNANESVFEDGSNSDKQSNHKNTGMFKRAFSFNGRIRRKEYCLSLLIYLSYWIILGYVEGKLDLKLDSLTFLLILLPALWFLAAQAAKRCHDRGTSGWYQFIPYYIWFLMFGEGETGENDYGDDPKEYCN